MANTLDDWREASQRFRDAYYSARQLGAFPSEVEYDLWDLWQEAQQTAEALVLIQIKKMPLDI